MKASQFIEDISRLGFSVFSVAEASRILEKSSKNTSLYLSRLSDAGSILRIEKGKYCIKGTSQYAIASNMLHPSYVSAMAAFKYYSLTTQNIYSIDVVSSARHGAVEVVGFAMRFKKVPRKLMFGFCRSSEDGAFVAYFEKALIDSIMLFGIPTPYIEEAVQNAKDTHILDKRRLFAYLERIGSRDLYRRVDALGVSVKGLGKRAGPKKEVEKYASI